MMIHNGAVCAMWHDAPPTHVVTRVAVEEDEEDDEEKDVRVRARRATHAWTGGKDGGIVRWKLTHDDIEEENEPSTRRRTNALGAVNYCAAHEREIVALVAKERVIVSVDASSVMCTWDQMTGKCLHKREIPREITAIGVTRRREETLVALGARARGPSACTQVHLCDALSERVLVLDAPRKFQHIVKIEFEDNGDICAVDATGKAQSWRDIGELTPGYGAEAAASDVDAFDLTGWSNIAKPIIQNDHDIDACGSFDHVIDSRSGQVRVHGDVANCILSFKDASYSLAERWNAAPNLAVTSCAVAKGGHYAPERSIVGYSDGTIRLRPLCGSYAKVTNFFGHRGAVLSVLDWVGENDQTFLISGGQDGTVRAWDYKTSENIAILRHHQGPIRLILPAPTNSRNGNWNEVFITVGDDGVLGLVSVNTWVVNFIMPGNGFSVKEIIWNAPRGVLAVLSDDDSLHVWDILTGSLERHLTGAAAATMNNNLREGSFYVTLRDSGGSIHRTWQFARKRARPIAWRCMQPSMLAFTANIKCLLEPTSSGLPSHGVKRRGTSVDSTRAENLPISGFFADEEERALHFLLGFLYPSSELDDTIFCNLLPRKACVAKIGMTGAKGSVTFDFPGICSVLDVFASRELRLAIVALIIRIVQVGEDLNIAPYSALAAQIRTIETVGSDSDLAFYAYHRMDSVECIREASKRLLHETLTNSWPRAFEYPAPQTLLSSEQFHNWDLLMSGGKSSSGLLGLIISSTACLLPGTTMDLSWKTKLPCILLDCLLSSDSTVVFTSASLLTEGMRAMDWWQYLPDPNKALEDVFKLSSTVAEKPTNPTESMIHREALSDLLSSFARASPPYFLTHMNNQLRTLSPEHPAHMLAFMALIRVAQTDSAALQLHAAFLMETVTMALNPSNAVLRKSCLQGAYALLSELGKSSSMAFHRETHRFAAAMHGAVKGGTLLVIYDLQTATKWRTLEDKHTEAHDKSSDESVGDWSNPMSYIASPEKSVKHNPNVLVDHVRAMSVVSSHNTYLADGELSVKAVSFDTDGNQLAAYLDKVSYVYVWDLTPSWRHSFTRGALSLGTSHYMPCVPSDAPLYSTEFGTERSAPIKCSLTFVKSRQLRLIHGEVDMVFSFIC